MDDFPVLIEDDDEDSVVLSGVITWIRSDDRYANLLYTLYHNDSSR